jgi:hypothetical protein
MVQHALLLGIFLVPIISEWHLLKLEGKLVSVMPAKAGIQIRIHCGLRPPPFKNWISAFAGMTEKTALSA